MARRLVQMRLPEELVEWADEYALGRASSRTAVVVAALEGFRVDVAAGVPDVPESEMSEGQRRALAFVRSARG